MADILFLAHRLPYPPNKGDKVRSYHLLRHLVQRHRVHLGTFMDDPDDARHIDTVRVMCADMHVAQLAPLQARFRSLSALATGMPLTLPYYADGGLREWVGKIVRGGRVDAAVVFSSAMAQYLDGVPPEATVIDLVDVDSAKWGQYASRHRWPMSWLYRREADRLLAFERAVAGRCARSFLSTENEADLFRRLAPECAARVESMNNGVDAEFFSPDNPLESPFNEGTRAIVFTGAMDYLPNIDAVEWFVREVMPRLQPAWPTLHFYIVGRAPAPAVKALASDLVHVTGTVDDVRPYLRHADVVVAPLRVARGIQNKVLEAMAMARPVVASSVCAEAVDAVDGRDFVAAGSAQDYADKVDNLLRDHECGMRLGAAGREAVLARYSWPAHLARLDRALEKAIGHREPVAAVPLAGSALPLESNR